MANGKISIKTTSRTLKRKVKMYLYLLAEIKWTFPFILPCKNGDNLDNVFIYVVCVYFNYIVCPKFMLVGPNFRWVSICRSFWEILSSSSSSARWCPRLNKHLLSNAIINENSPVASTGCPELSQYRQYT